MRTEPRLSFRNLDQPDFCAAPVAWLTVALIDVEPVVTGDSSRGFADLFGISSGDAVQSHALLELLYGHFPQLVAMVFGEGVRGGLRMDSDEKAELGAIDVADTGDDLLVEERRRDWDTPTGETFGEDFWIAVGSKRIRTQLVDDDVLVVVIDKRADHGAGEVPEFFLPDQPKPYCPLDFSVSRKLSQLSDQPQVDVEKRCPFELAEEVFSPRIRVDEALSVEVSGPFAEGALRGGCGDWPRL